MATTVVNMIEIREHARMYFSGELALENIEESQSVTYCRALAEELVRIATRARKGAEEAYAQGEYAWAKGRNEMARKAWMILYRLCPSWFKYESKKRVAAKH